MTRIPNGVVHNVPQDLRKVLLADKKARAIWESLTPLARNEWICWTVSVTLPITRKDHVRRVRSELKEGMRRPCCWYGCPHRKDKPLSRSVQFVINKKGIKNGN